MARGGTNGYAPHVWIGDWQNLECALPLVQTHAATSRWDNGIIVQVGGGGWFDATFKWGGGGFDPLALNHYPFIKPFFWPFHFVFSLQWGEPAIMKWGLLGRTYEPPPPTPSPPPPPPLTPLPPLRGSCKKIKGRLCKPSDYKFFPDFATCDSFQFDVAPHASFADHPVPDGNGGFKPDSEVAAMRMDGEPVRTEPPAVILKTALKKTPNLDAQQLEELATLTNCSVDNIKKHLFQKRMQKLVQAQDVSKKQAAGDVLCSTSVVSAVTKLLYQLHGD